MVDQKGRGDVEDWFDLTPQSLWWQLPAGVLLAAGVVSMTRRFRLRRLSRLAPGEQLAPAPPVAAGTEAAVSARAPLERLSTLQQLLRTVTPYAREQNDPPPVRAVELGEDRIEVVFTAPAPFPPQGWSTINGGVSWAHRFRSSTAPAVQQLITPALITLGLRPAGGDVLLDLETAGSLALVGARAASVGMARAMALEVATYPLGVPMDLCLIGLDVDGTELCDRTWRDTTLSRAVRVAGELLERSTGTGAPTLVAAHARLDNDDGRLDPHVFIVDTATVTADNDVALLDELVDLCTPQSGAALILIGDHPAARERIAIASADTAIWEGAELRPVVLDREAVAQVAVTFDHAVNADAGPLTPSPIVAELLADDEPDPTPTGPPDPGQAPPPDDNDDTDTGPDVVMYAYEPPAHDVLIQVLGDVAVHGRRIGNAVDVELLVLLAFKRHERPNVDLIRTILDRSKGSAVKTLLNRLASLRSKLGAADDGTELLTSTSSHTKTPARHCLSSRVLTDVDLIEHRYHTALGLASGDALAVLRDGLVLFQGPAFRGPVTGYSWTAPEGILQRVSTIVNNYAKLLMELAFDADDLPLVLEAAGHAGRVVDDPIALYPLQEVQGQMAEACGDPELTAAVTEARRRLRDHVDQYDPLAGN